MSFYKYYISLFICVFVSVATYTDSSAQKGKNTSEAEAREAEYYFIEGEKYFILEDYTKALALFQKSLETDPENATAYYKIAQILSSGNEYDDALKHIKQALDLEQENKYYYILAADIYSQKGDFKRASEIYKQIIAKFDKADQYLFELAALYLYQERYDEAIATYDKIEDAYGISEEIIAQKQKIYLQNNKLEEALEEGKRLIEAFPDNETYVLKQVEMLMSNGKDDEAEAYLNKFLAQQPKSTRSLLVLAELQRKAGDIEEAMKNLEIAFKNPQLSADHKIQVLAEYREALTPQELTTYGLKLGEILISVHTDVARAHTVYADLLQTLNKKRAAKDAYLRALDLDNSDYNVWQNVLQIYLELNRPDSVIMLSEEALSLFPNQGPLYYFNGAANLQKRKYQEAVNALEQGKKLSSSNLALLSAFNSMLGDAYNGTEEYRKSARAYEAALDYDPNNYAVLNNYSYFLALRGDDLEKAERMSAKTVKDNPDNATFLDTYAWVLYMRKKYKEAKKVIEHAISTGNVSAIHYEHYGDILYKLGDVDGAVKQWQQAKGLNQNSEIIDKKIADRKLYE